MPRSQCASCMHMTWRLWPGSAVSPCCTQLLGAGPAPLPNAVISTQAGTAQAWWMRCRGPEGLPSSSRQYGSTGIGKTTGMPVLLAALTHCLECPPGTVFHSFIHAVFGSIAEALQQSPGTAVQHVCGKCVGCGRLRYRAINPCLAAAAMPKECIQPCDVLHGSDDRDAGLYLSVCRDRGMCCRCVLPASESDQHDAEERVPGEDDRGHCR